MTSLPSPVLRKRSAGNRQRLLAPQRGAVGVVPGELERRDGGVVDLAEIVVRSRDFQPFGIGRDHPPRDEIVERRPPQHRLLAAGIHRDVAADARGVGGRRVDGEDQPFGFRRLHHALGHDPRAAVDRRDGRAVRADWNALDRREAHQLLGVDDRRARSEWNGAAGIARAAAARDDREPELDAARDERARLLLGVGEQDDERILDAPIGGVGDVRHAREAVERDVVLLRRAAEHAHGLCPERHGVAERALEAQHGGARRSNELRHIEVALGIGVAACQRILLPPLLDLVQPMHQRHDEEPPALRVVDQVVLQIGIALDDPDVTQHLEEHSRGATRAPLAAQLLQHVPQRRPEQADDDLPVGERRVVVRDLPQPRRVGGGILRIQNPIGNGVHDAPSLSQAACFLCALARTPRCLPPPTPPSRGRPCRSRRKSPSQRPTRTPRPRSDA